MFEHPKSNLLDRMQGTVDRYNKRWGYAFSGARYDMIGTIVDNTPMTVLLRLPCPGLSVGSSKLCTINENQYSLMDKDERALCTFILNHAYESVHGYDIRDGIAYIVINFALPDSWKTATRVAAPLNEGYYNYVK